MITVFLVSTFLVTTCVGIHYKAFESLSRLQQWKSITHRSWVACLVLFSLVAHIIEVSVFSLGYVFFDKIGGCGQLIGAGGDETWDFWYFSFVVYTSLGFGDITPSGPMRYCAALETLTGLILIAWTASFVFVEMQSNWKRGTPV